MAYSTSGQSQASFRDRTEKITKKMTGVSIFMTFRCRKCNEVKPVKGRKSNGYKNGFKCASCAEKSAA